MWPMIISSQLSSLVYGLIPGYDGIIKLDHKCSSFMPMSCNFGWLWRYKTNHKKTVSFKQIDNNDPWLNISIFHIAYLYSPEWNKMKQDLKVMEHHKKIKEYFKNLWFSSGKNQEIGHYWCWDPAPAEHQQIKISFHQLRAGEWFL